MKIEISEVFVLYTDSISTESKPVAIGIAALDPHRGRVVPNVKHWRIPTMTCVLVYVFEKIADLQTRFSSKQSKTPFLPDPMFRKVQKLDRFLTIS